MLLYYPSLVGYISSNLQRIGGYWNGGRLALRIWIFLIWKLKNHVHLSGRY